ncbi:PREDICTED: 28S ribosomal protein S14, mitochondrial [Dinoponera quadriceps]|uniref:28S ribosomal protein S14, mitochondrial n=1 Tax=Dinoponera quadriceps TaxID=609295 RepID=A0A6P3X9M3_DINQU|nr:PREDICTED: 28S ribosomal protein S14, mitochondrial [Dinoponera quadriceps]
MAALRKRISDFCGGILSNSINLSGCNFQQTRSHINARMRRDMKRRNWAKQYSEERLRLVVMKRNDILPVEIRELVGKQIDETIPRQTALRQLTPRCVVTSRGYGTMQRWRISRFIFRDLVDYNKISGLQRAIW